MHRRLKAIIPCFYTWEHNYIKQKDKRSSQKNTKIPPGELEVNMYHLPKNIWGEQNGGDSHEKKVSSN